jgi:hypothetical protein
MRFVLFPLLNLLPGSQSKHSAEIVNERYYQTYKGHSSHVSYLPVTVQLYRVGISPVIMSPAE